MFYFGVPLKSQKLAKNWDLTVELVNNTFRSMLAQTDLNFRILLACHEPPALAMDPDPRVEILTVDFPRPIFRDEPNVDKHRKREVIAARIRELGGGVVMFVDADDLVSNRLVEYVNHNPHPHGHYVQQGYEFNAQTRAIRSCPWFYRICGSCALLNLRPEDLPQRAMEETSSRFRQLALHAHPTWPAVMASEGSPLAPLPFPAVMYVTHTGENMSDSQDPAGFRRRLLRVAFREHHPSHSLKLEFAIR
ncbi:MAG: glycosyltransferase family A protein [Acidobacteriaceae bacterium]